jgi:predicted NAD/FAD-binding protein
MRIAIIGTGVSGMVAARLLHRDHDITVFESADRLGGHTNTVQVERPHGTYPVDTGFIVCNDRNYPNFLALMRHLGVPLRNSTMSFSVRVEASGLEWAGLNLDTLFCQRGNLFRWSFLRMVRDILRFNREALELLPTTGQEPDEIALGDWVRDRGYSSAFIDHYLVPMGGAIWSSSPATMLRFPARFFVRFFHHHGMLTVNDRPQWMTVEGGSNTYLKALVAPYAERIRRQEPVTGVRRIEGAVEVRSRPAGSPTERKELFDEVVLACHADEALAIIDDADSAERAVLAAFPYQDNTAVLHTDIALMPRCRKAWSAWNTHITEETQAPVAVTYDLTALQGLTADQRFLVTLNHDRMDPAQVIRRIAYRHPLFTAASPAAQLRHNDINGVRGLRFAGAYWRNGFHEDGVVSAINAVQGLTARTVADC